jgi:NAD(P)-dependent dehydrogenase (short-subunit alcohol dehydrogenase family)
MPFRRDGPVAGTPYIVVYLPNRGSTVGLLDGKVAVITGAGRGIGRGIARRFVHEGASVVVAELSAEHGEKTVSGIRQEIADRAVFVQTDVRRKEDIEGAIRAAVDRFGGLDTLVNNAIGLSPNILLEQKTDEMLDGVLRSGLWATWWAMRAALPHMKKRGGGRIINFYSIDADVAAWLHADYNLTKAAIQGLTRSAAAEWGRFNILVNAIAPTAAGTIFTELCEKIPGFATAASQQNPLGRVGDPEADIAPVAVFLASELARYVTGETINVDGGMNMPGYHSRPADLAARRGGFRQSH